MTPQPPVVTTPEELTPAWLTAALGRPVRDVRSEPVGTGQIGTCHRLHLDDGSTLLAKLPAADPAARDLLANAYRMECHFYREIAPTVDVRVPGSAYVAIAPTGGDFVLLLEDLAPAVQGDQLAGCTDDQARDAVLNLAGLHGPRWCDPALLQVDGLALNGPDDAALMAEFHASATETFLTALDGRLDTADLVTLRAIPAVIEAWALARADTFAPVHGDYRLDNLMFPPDGGPGVTAVDWQTLSLAHPLRDVAYFLGTCLDPDRRRRLEADLVAAYHRALERHDIDGYSLDQCWEDYRFAMLQGPLVSVFGLAYGTRTTRGDAMFAAMVTRSCAAIRDLDSLTCVGE